jgi:hypothetical protein
MPVKTKSHGKYQGILLAQAVSRPIGLGQQWIVSLCEAKAKKPFPVITPCKQHTLVASVLKEKIFK